ncbi:ATP-binding cassette sub-family A member 3 [Nymphon striatum]|nr:ATP-binding cassette sub-family A member 3 [Nymphon striatum]
MEACKQFLVLMKKNLILRKRHYIITCLEICFPLLACALIMLTSSLIDTRPTDVEQKTFKVYDQLKSLHVSQIAYAPMNQKENETIATMRQMIYEGGKHVEFLAFKDDNAVLEAYKLGIVSSIYRFKIAIIFDRFSQDGLSYTIRSDNLEMSKQYADNNYWGYYNASYTVTNAIIQSLIDKAYMDTISKPKEKEVLNKSKARWSVCSDFRPINVLRTNLFVQIFCNCPGYYGKQFLMLEFLKTMGLRNWVNFIAWFINAGGLTGFILNLFKAFAIHGLSAKLATCLLPNTGLYWAMDMFFQFEYKGVGLQWNNIGEDVVRGVPYSMLSIFKMYFVSWAIQIILIWYFDAAWPWQEGVPKPLYFPFTKSYWCGAKVKEILNHDDSSSEENEYIEIPPTGLKAGIEIKNLSKFGSLHGTHIDILFLMQYTHIGLPSLMRLILIHGHPGLIKMDWYKSSIQIFKVGSSRKTAVNKMSLKFFKGQVTALLGRNGAGKTTAISMISGMYPPSDGTVYVNGYDVRTNLHEARKSLGYCPQVSAYLDELTVKEHLQLIATLKGYPSDLMPTEIEKVIDQVKLKDKTNESASVLSGGMKRRLSLAMALIGDTKVLLLDEPTSGLDPEARKEVWNILQSVRAEKTVLLTTHYMEEADALGDRIAFMSDGSLFSVGTPLFLKNKFGAGYHLRMIKKDDCDVERILVFVREMLQAEIERDSGKELSLVIDFKDTNKFPDFFRNFQSCLENLCIESFSVSVTNMEDVFLKVDELVVKSNSNIEKDELDSDSKIDGNIGDHTPLKIKMFKPEEYHTGIKLIFMQVYALFLKRFHYSKRQVGSFCFLFVLPIAFVSAGVLIGNHFNDNTPIQNGTSTKVSLADMYKDTNVLYHGENDNIGALFKHEIEDQGCTPVEANDIQKRILKIADSSLYNYKYLYPIGAKIVSNASETNLTAMHNPFNPFGELISVNLIDNALLRSIHPGKTIETFNHPFPTVSLALSMSVTPVLIMIFMSMAMSFMSANCILFLVTERENKSKHLQLMTGVHPLVYWFSQFLWDILVCMVVSTICFLILIYGSDIGITDESRGALFMLFLMYNFAAIPLSYLFSFFTRKPTVSFLILVGINIVFGIAIGPQNIFEGYNQNDNSTTEVVFNDLNKIVKMFPTYAISRTVAFMSNGTSYISYCRKFMQYCLYNPSDHGDFSVYKVCCTAGGIHYEPYGFDEDACGTSFIYMLCTGLACIFLLVLIESPLFAIINRKFNAISKVQDYELESSEDGDVLEERQKISASLRNSELFSNYALITKKLQKKFKNCLAVADVTFGVMNQEYFGLLGVNGAGKTTTFSMLASDITMTAGEAFCKGYDAHEDLRKFQKQIGYCPQFDAILEFLTGREMLFLFARLRGIPSKEIKILAESLINLVNLAEHADKMCGIYSGGNKRKLSIAMAVIGLPPILFLDEPTSGIDPVSRRYIWNLLTSLKSSGISVVLTSHSMEECEALCDRLTIMVKGRLQCIGTIPHLKNKFGQGYTIYANMKLLIDGHDENRRMAITRILQNKVPSVVLKNFNLGMLNFHVRDPTEKWSNMFEVMESIKAEKYVEDYAITETTLEEVFLSFAEQDQIKSNEKPTNSIS